ncbi:MAG: adenosylcobinamide-GDP ribazoletransferase [Sulfolobales archaeon]
MSICGRIRALISLLTRIPLGGQSIEEAAEVFFLVPLVGALEGLVVSSTLTLLVWLGVNPVIVSVFYVFIHTVVTGGIHLDGFADYSDVLGSLKRGEQALRVLKDPRKGTYAIVAVSTRLIVGVVSLYVLIDVLELKFVIPLIASYIASAEAMFVSSFLGFEEPYEGMARSFTRHSKSLAHLFGNTLCYLLLSSALVVLGSLVGIRVSSAATLALPLLVGSVASYDANKRLGFVNGDVLGFSYELTKSASLTLVAVLVSAKNPVW